jgi:hypothetical protein
MVSDCELDTGTGNPKLATGNWLLATGYWLLATED